MSALSALFYFSNWWQIAASRQLLPRHRSGLTAHPYLVARRRGAVLSGLAPGGARRDAPRVRASARGVRVLLVVSAVGAVASAVEMAVLYRPDTNLTRLYFGTDTHAQSILVGACWPVR